MRVCVRLFGESKEKTAAFFRLMNGRSAPLGLHPEAGGRQVTEEMCRVNREMHRPLKDGHATVNCACSAARSELRLLERILRQVEY